VGVGKVYIVGAGPGRPDLISVRGARLLAEADLIVMDSLLPDSFLAQLGIVRPSGAIRHLRPGDTRDRQEEITAQLCAAARAGRTVVRLHGGDPFVCGRWEPELTALEQAGIPWEVVPGASCATAALTAAALPPTSRRGGRSLAVASARRAGGAVNELFPRADTLVVLMGVAVLAEVTAALVRQGWSPETPAAVLERATLPWERRVRGRLADVAELARRSAVAPPALLVVGAAAESNRAVPQRERILFTGLDPTNFRTLGDLLHWPALKLVRNRRGFGEFPAATGRLRGGAFAWAVFTSPAAVRFFAAALKENRLDARTLAPARVAAAGGGTAAELARIGVLPDAVAERPGGRGLIDALAGQRVGGVLLVQGAQAPDTLAEALRGQGRQVRRLALHKAVPHPELGKPLPEHEIIYFTSPSGVRAIRKAYGDAAFEKHVWCIGRVTRRALAALGVDGEVVNPNVPHNKNAAAPAH